jgi:hypothetical protein
LPPLAENHRCDASTFPQVSDYFPPFSGFHLTLADSYSMLAYMSKRVALGAAIKAIRETKAQHDTQFRGSHFSVACLMTPGHLCNIEQGRKNPPEDVIHRIAARLGVPVAAISYVIETEAAA